MVQLDYFERNLNTLVSILAKMFKLKYADLDVSEMEDLNVFCVNELNLDLKKLSLSLRLLKFYGRPTAQKGNKIQGLVWVHPKFDFSLQSDAQNLVA